MQIIDSHCHILPAIDDGSKSVEESLEMLYMMKSQGVDVAIATPHYYATKNSVDQFLINRAKSFENLKSKLDNNCPQIILGAETAFYFDMSKDRNLEKLCIEGTNTLLLELPTRTMWGDYEFAEIQNIVFNRDINVVIAHYERYKETQGKNSYYLDLLNLPVYIQITSDEMGSLFKGKENLKLFQLNQAHLLGSDAHNTQDRAPSLYRARKIIKNKLGQSKLDEIDAIGAKLFLGK